MMNYTGIFQVLATGAVKDYMHVLNSNLRPKDILVGHCSFEASQAPTAMILRWRIVWQREAMATNTNYSLTNAMFVQAHNCMGLHYFVNA